jgi:hypothetical protein
MNQGKIFDLIFTTKTRVRPVRGPSSLRQEKYSNISTLFYMWKNILHVGLHCRKSHLCIPCLVIARPQSQFPNSCGCKRFIPRIGPHISCSRIGRLIVGIYKSLTDTWMWKLGLCPRNSFSGTICFQFSVLVRCSVTGHGFAYANLLAQMFKKIFNWHVFALFNILP